MCIKNGTPKMCKLLTQCRFLFYRKFSLEFPLNLTFYNNNTWTNRPRGDLVEWRLKIRNIFSQGKPLEFLPWVKKPVLLMPAVGFEPTILLSLSGGVNTLVSPPPNHLATEFPYKDLI